MVECPPSALILRVGHEFWQNHFAENPQVLGMIIRLNDEPYTIVGVMPEKLNLLVFPADIWVPLALTGDQLAESARGNRFLYVFGRLKPGVPRETAQAEISNIGANLEHSHPQTNKDWNARLVSLQEFQILDGGCGICSPHGTRQCCSTAAWTFSRFMLNRLLAH
jgi:hypothetical protein